MVTHTLSTSQFGLLEIVADLVAFSTYPLIVVNFWSARETARGQVVGKTAVLSSALLMVLGLIIFILLAVLRRSPITTTLAVFLVALSLVPANFFYATVNSLLSVHNPEATGYILLAGELSKLALAYPLLFVFRVGLPGAIGALAGSNLVLGVFGLYFVRGTLADTMSLAKLKSWLKDGWLPALNQAPNLIGIADTFVAFLITGPMLVGYYQAAFSIALIVGYSNYLSYALYPLLLKGAGEKMIGTLFDFMMLFGVPMAVGATVLSHQFLSLLSRNYVTAAVPLGILAFSVLAGAVDTLVDQSLTGKESSDLAREDRFRMLLRSNIFFDAIANLGYATTYVGSVAVIVTWGLAASIPTQTVLTYWATSQLLLTVAFALIKIRRLGFGAFRGTIRPLGAYVISALVMGAAVIVVSPIMLITTVAPVYFGLRLAVVVGLGALIYFGALAAIDRKSRDWLRRIWGMFLP